MKKSKYVNTAEWVCREFDRERSAQRRHPVLITANEAKQRLKEDLAARGRLRGPDTL